MGVLQGMKVTEIQILTTPAAGSCEIETGICEIEAEIISEIP